MKNIYLSSLTSLAIMTAVAAHADQAVVVPTLEGGFTASVGTFFYATSAEETGFQYGPRENMEANNNGDYNFGWQATLGYVFEDTANSIELSYRGLDSTDTQSYNDLTRGTGANEVLVNAQDSVNYNLETGDLMLTQFVDFGDFVQMRFLGGLSYLFLERKIDVTADITNIELTEKTVVAHEKSKFSGFGPRVGLDARYDFGGEGFGIVGGASLAYFLGTMEYNDTVQQTEPTTGKPFEHQDNNDNHNVTNLRANLGIDYVYYMEDDDYPTFGLELGYLVDYYADAITANNSDALNETAAGIFNSTSATFSGPYLNLKGAF
jgi:hypothetical protein